MSQVGTVLRIATAAAFLLVMGCKAAREAPKSMCDLPRSFAGWQNTAVRWQGILLDAAPHGMTLIAEDCPRRGITIETWPQRRTEEAVNPVIRRTWRESGIIRAEVSGQITGDSMLAVAKVERIEFEPMSEQQEKEFWRSKGF